MTPILKERVAAAAAKKPRTRKPAVKKPKAPKPTGKGMVNSTSQTGARVRAAADAATSRMLSHDLLSAGPDIPAAGSAWDRDFRASTRLNRASQYLAARGKRTSGVYKMEAQMDYESSLMQAFAKNRYGVMSSKQRRELAFQNRSAKTMRTRPTNFNRSTGLGPKNLGGATGSQMPNRKAWERSLDVKDARRQLKAGLAHPEMYARAGAKLMAMNFLDRRMDEKAGIERSPRTGRPFKKAVDAALIEKARYGIAGSSKQRNSMAMQRRAGADKKGRVNLGSIPSPKTLRGATGSEAPDKFSEGRRHQLNISRRLLAGELARQKASGFDNPEVKLRRDDARRVLRHVQGLSISRAVGRDRVHKLAERIDSALIAKARYGAVSSKQRRDAAMLNRANAGAGKKLGLDFHRWLYLGPKNLGGAKGSQQPNRDSLRETTTLSNARSLLTTAKDRNKLPSPSDRRSYRASARRMVADYRSGKSKA